MYTPSEARRGTSPSKNGKFTISKSKSSRLSLILEETNLFETDRSKKGAAEAEGEVMAM